MDNNEQQETAKKQFKLSYEKYKKISFLIITVFLIRLLRAAGVTLMAAWLGAVETSTSAGDAAVSREAETSRGYPTPLSVCQV